MSFSEKWSSTTVGSVPSGWAGDTSKLNVQATAVDGDSARSLQTVSDPAAPYLLLYAAGDPYGGDGTYTQSFVSTNFAVGLFCLRGSGTTITDFTGYALQMWADPTGGGWFFLKFVAGSHTSGGGSTLASVLNPGSNAVVDNAIVYTATIAAVGATFLVQIRRGTDSKYLNHDGTWTTGAPTFGAFSASAVITDGSSPITGAGKFGYYEYSPTDGLFNFGDLSIAPIAVTATLGTTPLTAGGATGTATASGFTGGSVAWSSSDTAVATIGSSTGVYTPVGAGTCTFTATGLANSTQAATTATLTVDAGSGPAVSPTSATVDQLGTTTITASGFTGGSVAWSSSDATVATVNSSGVVTALAKAGTATITARGVSDNTQAATSLITVPAVAIAISPTSATLGLSGTRQFTATVTGTTNAAVTWTQAGGVSIPSGLFTASGSPGTATATATSQADPTRSASATITVAATVAATDVTNPGGGFAGLTGTITQVWQTEAGVVALAATTSGVVEVHAGQYRGTFAGATPGTTYYVFWDSQDGFLDVGRVSVPGAALDLSAPLGSPRALDSLADGEVTLADALWAALGAAVGRKSSSGLTVAIKTQAGTTLRTLTYDSTQPTSIT